MLGVIKLDQIILTLLRGAFGDVLACMMGTDAS
jgi:hypothetical protein